MLFVPYCLFRRRGFFTLIQGRIHDLDLGGKSSAEGARIEALKVCGVRYGE